VDQPATDNGIGRSPPPDETFVCALGHKGCVNRMCTGGASTRLTTNICTSFRCLAGLYCGRDFIREGMNYVDMDRYFSLVPGGDSQRYVSFGLIVDDEGLFITLPNVSTAWNLSRPQVVQWRRELYSQ